uniref:Transposase MuDR plant domain-containing protein n=1 Tax=Lactuca sativa TaxID=4236 RepID=A0A9R1W7M8_LACSA|nr:hypothetical protein LSAT_V11C300109760 [Lactuca sativa]
MMTLQYSSQSKLVSKVCSLTNLFATLMVFLMCSRIFILLCEKLYYCQPDLEIPKGLTLISSELQYQECIDIAYWCGVQLPVYMDHFGTTIHVTKENEIEDTCYVMSNCQSKGKKANETEDVAEGENRKGDEYDNVPDVKGKPMFNEDIPWKKQFPVLGMRFTNPKQLKFMLCNYVLANGKRLLVKCCDGECTFRLWVSWMSEENSFQIKSLINEHNCAMNFKIGSVVNYRWIGNQFTREVLENRKFNVRMLKADVKTKFGIEVSMGQCRRAKQHEMSFVEGTIVENFANLWYYDEEIGRSKPGLTIKLSMNSMPYGKTYFSRMVGEVDVEGL